MRRNCELTLLVALTGALAASACGGGLEVSLQLRPGEGPAGDVVDTSRLATLRVTFENSNGKDRTPAFAIDRERQMALPPLEVVDATEDFTVDVWGCERIDACDIDDVTMRGCTPEPLPFARRQGTEVVVVSLLPVSDERNDACPSP